MRKYFVFSLIYLFLFSVEVFAQEYLEECTVGVAAGKATVDGRPLLWKNRDTDALNNEVSYFTDGRFKYLTLVTANVQKDAWAGVNEMGFCIINSSSRDLKMDTKVGHSNGIMMKSALQNCVTIGDFEAMLNRTNVQGRRTYANFGVIDAFGGAVFFETSFHSYTKFDANDPDTAPQGYIVRANFSKTGGGKGGKIRYDRGEFLWKKAVSENKLSYRHILRTIARDLADENGEPYHIPINRRIKDNPKGTINTFDTINRWSTVSTALFQGVLPNENPSFTTFWAILGEPIFSVAVPCWVISEKAASELNGDEKSPLCSSVLNIKRANYYDYGKKKHYLKTKSLKDIWKITYPVEDQIFKHTENILSQWRQSYPAAADVLKHHESMSARAMSVVQEVEQKFGSLNKDIRVGIFADFGSSEKCIKETIAALKIDQSIQTTRVMGADIADDVLDNLDAIVFPGGSGSRQSCSLGDEGRRKVMDFVDNGGGYLGICAGSFLGSDHPTYDWCLHLADAHVIDREHYSRGGALVKVKLTNDGKTFLPEMKGKDTFFSYYHNGPLLTPGKNSEIEDYQTLALFQSDVHIENNAPEGVMPGTAFLLRSNHGKGRVLLCAGHPESTPGIRWLISRAVRWICRKEFIDYPQNLVKTDRFSDEILFTKDFKKTDSALLRKLVSNNKEEKLSAMKELAAMGSRDLPQWLTGQLRDDDSRVRKAAAEILLDLDYRLAKADLEQALENEKNEEIRQLLEVIFDKLYLKK